MTKKILITRLMGLGDVASVLIPAVRLVRQSEPDACIDVLTHGPGIELMSLDGNVSDVLGVSRDQWPRDLIPATKSFLQIAHIIASRDYCRIICLDTWFMPCFLAQVLKDIGLNVEGNHLDRPVDRFFADLHGGQLAAGYFDSAFMASTYPRMKDWFQRWWLQPQLHANYPEYYLIHCCELGDQIDIHLPIQPDAAFKQTAGNRKIVAVSFKGSDPIKYYKQAKQLQELLQKAGYHVWSRFNGSQTMSATLGQLAVTDLLITVATSTQWLARLVGCPSLMLPGAMHPAALGAEYSMEQIVDCQYCSQTGCPAGRNYACMDIPAENVMDRTRKILQSL